MKNEALYFKTVSILVQAYFNDTLRHDDCAACAVGNIVASNKGYEVSSKKARWLFQGDLISPTWVDVFATYTDGNGRKTSEFDLSEYFGASKHEIDCTGYTPQELSEIEKSFEMASYGGSADEWMFNGLMSVIETLDQIHENTNASVTTTSKAKFNKANLCPA